MSVQESVQQRVIRRLLTNPGDYIWHTDCGAGLGSYVGAQYAPKRIEGTILNQLQFEYLVAAIPAPSVQTNVSSIGQFSSTSVKIRYMVSGTSLEDSFVLGLDE